MLRAIGVTRIINGVGSTTLSGGSTLSPAVLAAIEEASHVYLDMPAFHRKVGEYIARLLGIEGAYVTSGASGALVLALTAIMTGGDLAKMRQVPRTEGMKNEVIVQEIQRNMYDRGIELTGASIVSVGTDQKTTEKEFRKAFNKNTAAVVYFVWDPQKGVLPLEKVIRIAHEHGVPVITDAAAELPPVENLTKFLKMGSDLAIFSGGKDIGGPNGTGLLLGRKDLVDMARRLGPHSYELVYPNASPYRRTVVFSGRPMKTSKEDVLGLAVALTEYLKVDQKARISQFDRRVRRMVRALSKQKAAKVRRIMPPNGHPRPLTIPRLELELKSARAALSLVKWLNTNDPPIHVWNIDNKVFVNPQCVSESDDDVIVARILAKLR